MPAGKEIGQYTAMMKYSNSRNGSKSANTSQLLPPAETVATLEAVEKLPTFLPSSAHLLSYPLCVSPVALATTGENLTRAAAAAKPNTLPKTGSGSEVRVTMGPSPKLMNRVAHRGAKSSCHTHLRCTHPAEKKQALSAYEGMVLRR